MILLVDDDTKLLSLGQEILEHLGHKVLTASDGDQALALYEAQRDAIRLVLLDFLLPCQDGYQILCRLQQVNPKVKVIIASGFFDERDIERFRRAGVAGMIHKPFRAQALEEEIRKALEGTSPPTAEPSPAPAG